MMRTEKFSRIQKIYPLATLLPCMVFAAGAALQWQKQPFFALFNGITALIFLFTFLWQIVENKIWRWFCLAVMILGTIASAAASVMEKRFLYAAASAVVLVICFLICGKYTLQQAAQAQKANSKKKSNS